MKTNYPFKLVKNIFYCLLVIIITGFSDSENSLKNAKTTAGGEVTFTIRTLTAGGNYAPKHVLAIWVEKDGNFVKTRKAMANQRKQYLYTWKAASNYNVVDAITGATLTTHQTHTVYWNCTDLDGNLVPDGDYVIYTEFTDQHAQGPLYSLTFTKGPNNQTLNPPDETYFKDIALQFTPHIADFEANMGHRLPGRTGDLHRLISQCNFLALEFRRRSHPRNSKRAGTPYRHLSYSGIENHFPDH
jgi:hypothetical protein